MVIGIDNGSTGSAGTIEGGQADFFRIPSFKDRNYTKKKAFINRVDTEKLKDMLPKESAHAWVERPMVNFKATAATVSSAIRALEAVVITLEQMGIPYDFIDSKEWQGHFFGSHTMGREALKQASALLGQKMFPHLKEIIKKQKDADGILIAAYAREVLCTS